VYPPIPLRAGRVTAGRQPAQRLERKTRMDKSSGSRQRRSRPAASRGAPVPCVRWPARPGQALGVGPRQHGWRAPSNVSPSRRWHPCPHSRSELLTTRAPTAPT
jgi:hypothetical protein